MPHCNKVRQSSCRTSAVQVVRGRMAARGNIAGLQKRRWYDITGVPAGTDLLLLELSCSPISVANPAQ